jgi:transposase
MDFLEGPLAQRQKDLDPHLDRHPELKQALAWWPSIPAVGPQVGCSLLCVMRSIPFRSAQPLAADLGVVPVERPSGTSVRGRAHWSKAGSARIRALWYRSARVAIRYNPQVKALYERLLARSKSKMAAWGAAMRKFVPLCFGVLKIRSPYSDNFASSP